MKTTLLYILSFLLVSLPIVSPANAKANDRIFPLSKIQKGQEGIGYTVFEGKKREQFKVVIVGVLENFLGPQQDIIVATLHSDKLDFTGVIAGMSGSPVYINDKLVGAVGYAFSSFAKEALCGITPIQSMNKIKKGFEPLLVETSQKTEDLQLMPIKTPLVASGIPDGVLRHFSEDLNKAGYVVAGSTGNAKNRKNKKSSSPAFFPGAPVAAVLVDGDVRLGAIGTVTDVQGDHVLAFGHPFMGAGDVEVGMAQADVVTVVASQRRSFKMANIGSTVGTIIQDRLPGIRGVTTRKPTMIPVSVTINDGGDPKNIKFNVFRHITRTPVLLSTALAGALTQRLGQGENGTVIMDAKLEIPGFKPLHHKDIISSQGTASLPIIASLRLGALISALWQHPFGAPPPISIDVQVKVLKKSQVEWIESIAVDKLKARAGETVTVQVNLRKLDGPSKTIQLPIPIPKGVDQEKILITVSDSSMAEQLEHKIAPQPKLSTFANYVKYFSSLRKPGYLYFQVIGKRNSISIGTSVLHHVPGIFAMNAVGGGDKLDGVGQHAILWEERVKRSTMVQGQAATEVIVVKY